MARTVSIRVNGVVHAVSAEASLAAALLNAGYSAFRRSVNGDARGPLCGMGTCFECRVTVDGAPGVRACLLPVHEGMTVVLDA